jgi:hypothetical protein
VLDVETVVRGQVGSPFVGVLAQQLLPNIGGARGVTSVTNVVLSV